MQELLAKGPIEPSSIGAGFYSNVFEVPKHMGVSDLIAICMYLLLRCLLFNKYSNLCSRTCFLH